MVGPVGARFSGTSKRPKGLILTAMVVGVLATSLGPPEASAAHLPNCVGLTPTVNAATPGGTLSGTQGDDVIVGTGAADVINARAGNDVICGAGGDDRIIAGDGNDLIDGGDGNDVVNAGEGDDRLAGGTGDDHLGGGEGDDLLSGGEATDRADGGPGTDSCGAEASVGCETARRGTLVVGETFAIPPSNPAVNTNGSTHAYWEIMYNGLLALDEAGNPVPELAIAVPTTQNQGITDDGRTYTFRLRDDVYWHDDEPSGTRRRFTAADVKFTFEKALLVHHARTRNMTTFLQSWDGTNKVASIDALDDFTVRFRFARPYAPLLKQLNVTEAPIIPAHRYVGLPPSSYDTQGNPTLAALNVNTVGTGPMEYGGVTATEARVVRNSDYFRSGLPFLDEIVMKPIPGDAARYNALVTGEVDWVWDVPTPSVAALEADPAFRTASTQSLAGGPNSIDQFIFNLTLRGTGTPSAPKPGEPARYGQIGGSNPTLTAPPHPILGALDDVDPDGESGPAPSEPRGRLVRRAIAQAIDRDSYLHLGRHGIGKVATAPLSSELPQHATDIELPAFDAAEANRLLDVAGWDGPRDNGVRTSIGVPGLPDGTPLSLFMLQQSLIFSSRVARIDADLAQVGIDLQVEQDLVNSTARVFTHRNFDAYILNYAQGYDPHVGVRRQYHSDQVSTTGTPNNAPGYKNPVVDAAFDEAVQTIDPLARFQSYRLFQEEVARDLPYVWLIETPNVRGYRASCANFQAHTGLFAEAAYCTG